MSVSEMCPGESLSVRGHSRQLYEQRIYELVSYIVVSAKCAYHSLTSETNSCSTSFVPAYQTHIQLDLC